MRFSIKLRMTRGIENDDGGFKQLRYYKLSIEKYAHIAILAQFTIFFKKDMKEHDWQRIVIKVGSALVSPEHDTNSTEWLLSIANFINHSMKLGKEVILVSSGSIAAAKDCIACGQKATIAEKQAMAAVGQMKIMSKWANLIDAKCAQILLTESDLTDRKRFVNVKNTIEQLLENNILPIVNENDTVAVDEIKVGDNDNLAAHTAIASQADCLVICTDVNGLYTANPRVDKEAKLIESVKNISPEIFALAGGAGTKVGTGGMVTKLQAAQKCTLSGIDTVLVNGKNEHALIKLASGDIIGTLFCANTQEQSTAKQDWLSHTIQVRGIIYVDAGAKKALLDKGASLLAAGIKSLEGNFNAGDGVEIKFEDTALAKGLVAYSNTELSRILGRKSAEITEVLGYDAGEAVVHRDNLVLRR